MKKMAKVSAKKYMTGGMTNPNKGQMMTAAGVKSAKPKSKGSGDANPGKVPTGATPGKKMSSSTTFTKSKASANKANAGLYKKGGSTKKK
jgi:hypothetical protein